MIPHLHQTVFLYYPYIYKSVFGRFLLLQLSKVHPCSDASLRNYAEHSYMLDPMTYAETLRHESELVPL